MQETFKRVVRQDIQPDAAHITVPTLLVYATGRRIGAAQCRQDYRRLIKNSRLKTVDGGHFLHNEQSSAVTRVIEEFLK